MKAEYAVLVAFMLGLVVSALFLGIPLRERTDASRTAYARGYAACADSVRALRPDRTAHDDIADILRSHGIAYTFVLALKSETDSTVAVIHAGGRR